MNKLIIFFSLQFVFLFWLLFLNKLQLNNKRTASYSTIFFYISIIVFVVIEKITLRNYLDSFDLNSDGFFTDKEITSEQQIALKKVSSDTNLILAPIVGILYSLIYFLILFVSLKIFRKQNGNPSWREHDQ